MAEASPGRMRQLAADGWDWIVRGYYGPAGRKGTRRNPNRGRPGERAGELALETVHRGTASKDAEVAAFESREDIGVVQVIPLREQP